jgi:Zn-dependent M16 (insulinase) family peptidase
MQTLRDVQNDGIDKELFEQTLHQVEFQAKKTRKATGLTYISLMTPYSLHGGDPLDLFRINEFSNKIREDYNKGGLFEGLIEKHLTNNRHYL